MDNRESHGRISANRFSLGWANQRGGMGESARANPPFSEHGQLIVDNRADLWITPVPARVPKKMFFPVEFLLTKNSFGLCSGHRL